LFLQVAGWREWWLVMAFLTLLPVPLLLRSVPKDQAPAETGLRPALLRVGRTVVTRPPWIIGMVFACYTAQWMAVLGFLPSIYRSAGLGGAWPGILSAVVGGVNAIGALSAGPLIQRGLSERKIIFWTFLSMSAASVVTFAVDWGRFGNGLIVQVVLIAFFSAVGGLIPAAVTSYSVRIAPADGSVTAVLGLTQQIFNVGNFLGPMMFALLATSTGGWGTTWWLTCGLSAVGMVLLAFLGRARGVNPSAARRSDKWLSAQRKAQM
jgi:predicted MFS family arabinose efflux permease